MWLAFILEFYIKIFPFGLDFKLNSKQIQVRFDFNFS